MDYLFTTTTQLLYPLILGGGIFSCIRLLSANTKEIKLANILLVALLIVLLLPMWNGYVTQALSSDILKIGWPLNRNYWLIAPLMYLYFVEIFSSKPNRQLYFIHAIPFALIITLENIVPLNERVFFKISIVVWVILTLFYAVLLVTKLFQARRQYQQTHSSALAIEFKWSLVLLVGLILFSLLDMSMGVYIILGLKVPDSLKITFLIARSIFVVGIVSYTLHYKLVLKKPLDLSIDQTSKKDPVDQLRLTESAATSLMSMLERKMEDDFLFSSPNLNLRGLAAHLGITTHELSEVFNTHMGTTFYRYVNEKRINYAKTLLAEDSEKSIVDIALLCGYGSKTTFYDNFKKICNITPKEYRATVIG